MLNENSNTTIMKHCIFLILFLSFFSLYAQDESIVKGTEQLIKGEGKKSDKALENLMLAQNQSFFLQALVPYFRDTVASVRSKAYSYTARLGVRALSPELRQKCVEYLVSAWTDRDAGVVSVTSMALSTFTRSDFSLNTIDTLCCLLKKDVHQFSRLIRICGFAGTDTLKKALLQLTDAKILQKADNRWSRHLALARCGNTEDIDYCVRITEKMPLNDDYVDNVIPDLIYTHQRACYDAVIKRMGSDDKNCMSVNPTKEEHIVCGFIIMEYFAGVVEGFPFEKAPGGGLKTDDYPGALKSVREWFAAHKDYVISTDKY